MLHATQLAHKVLVACPTGYTPVDFNCSESQRNTAHETLHTKYSARNTVPGTLCPEHCARNTVPGTLCVEHCARNTVPRTLCPEHCARNTVRGTLCPEHCAQNTVPGTLCSEHCARNTVPGTLCPEHCARNTVPGTLCPEHCARNTAHNKQRPISISPKMMSPKTLCTLYAAPKVRSICIRCTRYRVRPKRWAPKHHPKDNAQYSLHPKLCAKI